MKSLNYLWVAGAAVAFALAAQIVTQKPDAVTSFKLAARESIAPAAIRQCMSKLNGSAFRLHAVYPSRTPDTFTRTVIDETSTDATICSQTYRPMQQPAKAFTCSYWTNTPAPKSSGLGSYVHFDQAGTPVSLNVLGEDNLGRYLRLSTSASDGAVELIFQSKGKRGSNYETVARFDSLAQMKEKGVLGPDAYAALAGWQDGSDVQFCPSVPEALLREMERSANLFRAGPSM